MSRRIGDKLVILEATEDEKCQICGKTAECRPYGPNGKNICYECGMKDEETTKKRMNRVLFEYKSGLN